MFARYGDTRGMDHMRLHPARPQPARQPEAVPTSLEGQCNPRDLFTGPNSLIAPAMQQGKQPFWARLQLLARLALNAGKHTGNQPTRLAHLDDGNDCAILVQGDEGPAQGLPWRKPGSFGWGIGALHRLATATMVPSPRRLPHSISRSPVSGDTPQRPLITSLAIIFPQSSASPSHRRLRPLRGKILAPPPEAQEAVGRGQELSGGAPR